MIQKVNDKVEILIFNQYFVPGFKGGGPIVSILNLATLLQNDYRVRVICRNRDGLTTQPYPNVKSGEWSRLPESQIEVFYAQDSDLNVKSFIRLIEESAPDYIYLNSFFNFKFTVLPVIALTYLKFDLSRIVLNPRGEVNPGALEIKPLKKKFFIKLVKATSIHKKIIWNPTNESEKQELLNVLGRGLQYKLMSNVPRQLEINWQYSTRARYNRFVFLSRIDRIKNIELFLSVLSQINENVIFDIYGPIANISYWEECKSVISSLPANITVSYRGEVQPAKVIEVLSNYDYFVLPSKGENFGHAIMDALSASLPILISDNTPWSSRNVRSFGFDLPIDEEKQWCEAVISLLAVDSESYNLLSRQAYETAKKVASDPQYLIDAAGLFPEKKLKASIEL